jgi:VWFA-related protein
MRSYPRIRTLVAALALVAANVTPAVSQEPDEDVTQLSVTLVQIDAVVTDERGEIVRDLAAGDFEIFEDGRPQELTGFSFVSTERARPAAAPAGTTPSSAPPPSVTPARVRRTVAFVVDDLFIAAENVPKIKDSMRKFVDEQMQPGDLVAIVQTGGSGGALQQFTSDKRELHAAIDRVRWNPKGVKGASTFTTPDESMLNNRPTFGGSAQSQRFDRYRLEEAKRSLAQVERHRSQAFAVTMLGVLGDAVGSLDMLPGRKSVVLFSEGFRVLSNEFVRNYDSGEGTQQLSLDAYGKAASGRGNDGLVGVLKQIVDRANRAAVSIYAVDPRGVVDPSLATAQYGTIVMDRERRDQILGEQRDDYFAASTALHYLADKTGGEVSSSNDPGYGIRRAVDGLAGYYSLAYVPETTFDGKDAPEFHEISVRVKRPGLKVRARSGFYGVTDEELRKRRPLADRVAAALTSPFGSSELAVRLSSQVVAPESGDPSVRAVVHVDASDFTFTRAKDGANEATVGLFALLFASDGTVAGKAERTETLRVDDAALERVRRDGVTFVVGVPVKRPGAYRVRAAVREAASERIGAAGQFVEVPDVSRGAFSISGVLLGGEGAGSRRYRPGAELPYGFIVYNAATGNVPPRLTMQLAIWRDGKRLFEGPAEPLALAPQPSWRRVDVAGSFKLTDRIRPGQYQLQITVAGPGAPATEWTDFEVVN